MTASANTIQYRSMPSSFSHTRTDRPNEAPSDSATVPTMTRAATRLRVMNIMMSRIRLSAAIPAISRSYLAPYWMSLNVDAVPAR